MRLPRDISGDEVARLLRRRYGYQVTRQAGSHMQLTSTIMGTEGHVSIPRHRHLRVGTLRTILSIVGEYLEIEPRQVRRELFMD